MGINTPGKVNHPIVLTEPVCNPNYCRQCKLKVLIFLQFEVKFVNSFSLYISCIISAMSELLFECYNVPSVAYGIDSLFSLYNNNPNTGKV